MGYEPNYRWLIHFAQKLNELLRIPGYEHIVSRLSGADTYASASDEMGFALKLTLSGLPCRFGYQRGTPTPDLVTQIGGQETDVEITSLNRPYEDAAGIDALSSVTMIAMQANCVSGGIWAHVPSPRELEEVGKGAQEIVNRATSEHRMIELNIPGLLTCFIAPQDLASEIPGTWLGSFVMRTRSPSPKKDRLARTIIDKAKLQLSSQKPSVLVVYDRFSSPEEIQDFINEKEIELVVGTFRNLAAVILVYPFNSHESPPRRIDQDGRSYVEYSIPDGESERCVIWRNPMANHDLILEAVVDCLTQFPSNLNRLFSPSQGM